MKYYPNGKIFKFLAILYENIDIRIYIVLNANVLIFVHLI